MMNVSYEFAWYEYDQTVMVDDIDIFTLTSDYHSFYTGDDEYVMVKAKIINIYHHFLGRIKGIITYGFDYSIILENNEIIEVNSEEEPGKIYDKNYEIDDWKFSIEIELIIKSIQDLNEIFPYLNNIEIRTMLSEERKKKREEFMNNIENKGSNND